MIKLKRVYEEAEKDDGFRVLVERLWPRGMTKDRAHVDLWLKDVSPSPDLRKWYGHEPAKWPSFCRRYWGELRDKRDLVKLLKTKSRQGNVTFVYAASDEEHNSAAALRKFVEHKK